MIHDTAPTQALASTFTAAPGALWSRVSHSAFIADYLAAQFPPRDLNFGDRLDGVDRHGQALQLHVTEATPPHSLSIAIHAVDGVSTLLLSIAPAADGSRLTLLHGASAERNADADPIDRLLRDEPAAALRSGRVATAEALAATHRYLSDSAQAVRALLDAMAPGQGYDKPADGGFSLVEHLWHLADVESFGWAERMKRVRDETRPVLPGVNGDRLAIERRYQQRPWRGAARRFVAQRRQALAVLGRLPAARLGQPVVFSGRETDVGELLAAWLAHDHEHRLEMAQRWADLRQGPTDAR